MQLEVEGDAAVLGKLSGIGLYWLALMLMEDAWAVAYQVKHTSRSLLLVSVLHKVEQSLSGDAGPGSSRVSNLGLLTAQILAKAGSGNSSFLTKPKVLVGEAEGTGTLLAVALWPLRANSLFQAGCLVAKRATVDGLDSLFFGLLLGGSDSLSFSLGRLLCSGWGLGRLVLAQRSDGRRGLDDWSGLDRHDRLGIVDGRHGCGGCVGGARVWLGQRVYSGRVGARDRAAEAEIEAVVVETSSPNKLQRRTGIEGSVPAGGSFGGQARRARRMESSRERERGQCSVGPGLREL